MQKCLLKRAVSFNFLKWKQNLLSLFPFPNLKKKTLCNMKTGQKTAQADNDIKGNKKKSQNIVAIISTYMYLMNEEYKQRFKSDKRSNFC